MIEQEIDEIVEGMQDDPEAWAILVKTQAETIARLERQLNIRQAHIERLLQQPNIH